MLHFITHINEIKPYQIECVFNTNETKLIDFTELIMKNKDNVNSVFSKLYNAQYFANVALDSYGTLCWNNEIDFCPDVLYSQGKLISNG